MALVSARLSFLARQAALAACLVLFLAPLPAQQKGGRLLPRYATIGQPDQAEGREILQQFRRLGIVGDYFFAFSLDVLPRRGERHEIPGHLWGGRNAEGPISRLTIRPPGGGEERLLVQNGPSARAWLFRPAGGDEAGPALLDPAALMEPLAGTEVTPFDLQMPFLYWDDFVFEGATRVRGRTAYAFLLYPPERFTADDVALGGVRVFLDLQFNAMMQAEQLAPDGTVVKTMTVIDLKRVGETWIVKSIDLRDNRTRNKTRFRVTAAGVGLSFSPRLFEPEMLIESVRPPAPAQLERVD